jgi:hypothetical protein
VRLQCDLCSDISFLLCLLYLLDGIVVRCYISLMMFIVVELHDLAGDGGFERTVIICIVSVSSIPQGLTVSSDRNIKP